MIATRRTTGRSTGDVPGQSAGAHGLLARYRNGTSIAVLAKELVTPATVRNALRRYAATRAESAPDAGPTGPSDPERRFAVASGRIKRARRELERARQLQVSAVSELHRSGLTVAAIADRLDSDVDLVEALLAHQIPLEP